jgi:hypothetical protein
MWKGSVFYRKTAELSSSVLIFSYSFLSLPSLSSSYPHGILGRLNKRGNYLWGDFKNIETRKRKFSLRSKHPDLDPVYVQNNFGGPLGPTNVWP